MPELHPAARRCLPAAGSSVRSGVSFLVTLAAGWQAPAVPAPVLAPDPPALQGSQPRGGGRAPGPQVNPALGDLGYSSFSIRNFSVIQICPQILDETPQNDFV